MVSQNIENYRTCFPNLTYNLNDSYGPGIKVFDPYIVQGDRSISTSTEALSPTDMKSLTQIISDFASAPADDNYVSTLDNNMDFIDVFLKQRENLIQNAVLEIKILLQERKQLHQNVKETLNKLICRNYNLLKESISQFRIGMPEFIKRKTELDIQISTLVQEKIKEELLFWKDMIWLNEQLREMRGNIVLNTLINTREKL